MENDRRCYQEVCSDCETYGLKKHGLTRSDCILWHGEYWTCQTSFVSRSLPLDNGLGNERRSYFNYYSEVSECLHLSAPTLSCAARSHTKPNYDIPPCSSPFLTRERGWTNELLVYNSPFRKPFLAQPSLISVKGPMSGQAVSDRKYYD